MLKLFNLTHKFCKKLRNYPFLLSPNYDFLQYTTFYTKQAKKLQIQTRNIHQIDHIRLPKFLINQIQYDKTLFVKEKEFIFCGRSNSGKSRLINTIFRDKTIARRAKKPGTTSFLHFHKIKKSNAYIIDAPGYGFAKMNKRRRQLWFSLTQHYLKISSRVSQIFLCINFQHGLKIADMMFLHRAHKFNIDIQIILTKVDKVKEKDYFSQLQSINQSIRRLNLNCVNDRILACSSKSQFGIDFLRCRIIEAIQHSKQRNIDNNEQLLISYLKQLRIQPVQAQKKQKQISKEHIVRKLIYQSKLTKFLV